MSPIALLAAAAGALAGLPATAATREWHFEVSADGRPIGTHTFTVNDTPAGRTVEATARFNPKLLFVPLYHYEHHDREFWKDGCLQQIQAATDDNGQRYRVEGTARQDGFRLDFPQPAALLAGCVRTFAYWDRRFLQTARLLNSQTGEYLQVTVTRGAMQRIQVQGRELDAERYTLTAPRFTIDLWYSPEGEWLALESLTEKGHRLRYDRQ